MEGQAAARAALDPARRDHGLDALRVLALTLMVSIHYFQRLPSPTPLTEALNFVGEASAPLFFFAFGLTYHRHRAKSASEKVRANLGLLSVALAHNLFLWGTLTIVDFLCFLVLWRALLDAMGALPRDHWLWLGISGGTLALALALPQAGMIDGTFAQLTRASSPCFPGACW